MKTMKKAISVLLLVCMVSALCSAGAYADNTAGTGGEGGTAETPLYINIKSSITEIDLDLNASAGKTSFSFVGNLGEVDRPSWFISGTDSETWTWTVADSSIASAESNSGTITALKVGETTVSGKVVFTEKNPTNGSTAKTATATTQNPIPIKVVKSTSVTITKVNITGSGSGPYSATAEFSDGADRSSDVNWTWAVDPADGNVSFDQTTGMLVNKTFESKTVKLTATASATINGSATTNSAAIDNIVVSAKSVEFSEVTIKDNGNGSYTASATFTDGQTHDISSWAWSVTPNNSGVSYSVSGSSDTVTLSNSTDSDVSITLTATASANIGGALYSKDGSLPVTVPAQAKVVTDVTLDKKSVTIATGNSTTLIATVTPSDAPDAKNVNWESSDPSVATVDSNGKVTAVKEGTAKVTATAGDKSATCDVTVTKAASVRIDVSSNLANNTITARGGNIVLYANVYKDNQLVTSYPVSWNITKYTSSNGLINPTDCGYINNAWTALVTGNFNGDYTLTAACVIDNVTYSRDISVKVAYAPSIVAGNYSVWNGRDALSFIVNDHISNWSGNVWIDGILVSNAYYTCIGSSDGEIWLTLSPSLLNMVNQNNPKNSTHTLTIGDTRAAAATGYFRTWGTASSFNGVKTGDDANLGLWAALLAVSAVGAGAAVIIVKRRKTNNG